MPRHPPIALKTLDHSHCQCPSSMFPRIKDPRKDTWTNQKDRDEPNLPDDGIGRKDQLLEICSMVAVRLTNHLHGIERPMRRTTFINTRPLHESTYGAPSSMTELRWRNPNKSSLHNVMQNRRIALQASRKPFFFLVTCQPSTSSTPSSVGR
jgi:hypothetical protein